MQTDIIEGFELSPQQKRLWLLQQNNFTYQARLAIIIKGNLNVKILKQALYNLINRHEILRTTFHSVPDHKFPIQSISDRTSIKWQEIDLSSLSFEKQEGKTEELLKEEDQNAFNLEQEPLVRSTLLTLSAQQYILLLTLPSLCADTKTLDNIVKEISDFYIRNRQNESDNLPIQYVQFSAWQNEILEEETGTGYWQEKKIYDFLNLKLPFEAQLVKKLEFKSQFLALTLSPKTLARIKDFVQQHEISTFVFFQTCWLILLWRLIQKPDIVIGTICDNRSYEGLEEGLGLFAKYLPVHCHLEDDETFMKTLQQVDSSTCEAYAWQEYFAWEQIVGKLENFDAQSVSLFCFDFEEQDAHYSADEVSFRTYRQYTCIDRFKVKLSCIDREGIVITEFHYDSSLFSVETIERLAGQFNTLLESVLSNSDMSISQLQILSAAEQQQLLVEWNKTQVEYPQDKCIHQLFEAQVEQTPDAIAVVFENEQLTYRELNERANQLAHHLQTLGVEPDVLVGICVEHSLEMVVGLLGILKTGGAYVPLAPEYPPERLAFILADAQVSVLLTQQLLVKKLPEYQTKIICLDSDWEAIAQQSQLNSVSETKPLNLAYVIYTSGSTGVPKGVLLTHLNVTRLFAATQPWFHFNQQDVWTLFHSIAFDFSVWELWGALLNGSRLVVVPYWLSRSPVAFYDLVCKQQVTVLNQTPGAFRQLIQAETSLGTAKELVLRWVIFGGEALNIQSLKPWFERHGDRSAQLVNMYGITETTVHVTYRLLSMADLNITSGSHIGRPIPDLQVYLLDQHQQLVPVGVPGEIYVGGAGLARGYLNRPDLNSLKFIANPFCNRQNARLYSSGDLARFLPNGELEYLGRIDHQVKVRGFRIELGEIEAVLSLHPALRQVVVLAQEDKTSHQCLVAYIVPARRGDITTSDLRSFLLEKLPEYMIPSAFLLLESLPLTTNGKVDRQALLSFNLKDSKLNANFVAPRTAAENVVADIWKQVLSVHQIGIHDNFFELGGHSLLATQVFLKLHKIFQVELSLRHLFETPTVEGIVNVIEQNRGGREVVEKIAQTLIEVKKLSLQVKKTLAKEKT